jgi:DNA-binding response OmpR family regulator
MRSLALRPDPREERIAVLEAEVEQLRRLLGIQEEAEAISKLGRVFKIPRGAALLLLLLRNHRGRVVSKAFIDEWLPTIDHAGERASTKIVDVYVCRLRRRMGSPAIETVWGIGYKLSASALTWLDQLLGPEASH